MVYKIWQLVKTNQLLMKFGLIASFLKYFVLPKDFETMLKNFLFKVLVSIQILTKSQFHSLVLVLVTLAKG
jgi:hypothetical protein